MERESFTLVFYSVFILFIFIFISIFCLSQNHWTVSQFRPLTTGVSFEMGSFTKRGVCQASFRDHYRRSLKFLGIRIPIFGEEGEDHLGGC
ncbi:hypothetical protein BU24DRAFT_112992 [Aaosphaeria arxii CBS 175.79]|uniref:Uncharacterized protein n=1 Tax=Aaosphaeria arxii CBS 175.79 TaxID=1450172 RepID=A0A6A5Y3I9_9PLEO|nr:uncharacterized protein BU24DRAFT_112992 [Aaosphaeria arxii CBS 175.79]KAF2019124.1 hypothetical protein BU24DRAFT_112992 [Aaosphaeria arxii CBS 175.79]